MNKPSHQEKPSASEIFQKKLESEAIRRTLTLAALQEQLIAEGLAASERQRAQEREAAQAALVASDVLLITATISEHKGIREIAERFGMSPIEKRGPSKSKYTLLTAKNGTKIAEIKLDCMGPDETLHGCNLARIETQATTIILVGTAFGINSKEQKIGDVLLSSGVLSYDERNVYDTTPRSLKKHLIALLQNNCHDFVNTYFGIQTREWILSLLRTGSLILEDDRISWEHGWSYEYRNPIIEANEYWQKALTIAANELRTQPQYSFNIHPGVLLSGGARIESERYSSLLVSCANVGSPIVGGDMETAAVASLAKRLNFGWIAVKSISDFAETNRTSYLEESRLTASRNAAALVLHALSLPPPTAEGASDGPF